MASYAINQGSVAAGSNYIINYSGNNFTIDPAALTIAANAASKTYGDVDPSLTYAASGFKNGDTAAVLSGGLTRAAGENVASYAINQGSVAAGSNYTINYIGNFLTINQAPKTPPIGGDDKNAVDQSVVNNILNGKGILNQVI